MLWFLWYRCRWYSITWIQLHEYPIGDTTTGCLLHALPGYLTIMGHIGNSDAIGLSTASSHRYNLKCPVLTMWIWHRFIVHNSASRSSHRYLISHHPAHSLPQRTTPSTHVWVLLHELRTLSIINPHHIAQRRSNPRGNKILSPTPSSAWRNVLIASKEEAVKEEDVGGKAVWEDTAEKQD